MMMGGGHGKGKGGKGYAEEVAATWQRWLYSAEDRLEVLALG